MDFIVMRNLSNWIGFVGGESLYMREFIVALAPLNWIAASLLNGVS